MPVDQTRQEKASVLLVDDDDDFRWATGNVLSAVGYRVIQALNGPEAISYLEKDVPSLVLLDYRMPGQDGLSVAAEMKKLIPGIPIVMITAFAEIDSAVKAMKMGIYDYVTKPADNNDLIFTIKRALEKQNLVQKIDDLRSVLNERNVLYRLMGNSDPIKKLIRNLTKVAGTSFTVLIEGESGTGKELIARAIHNLSNVKKGPFVAVDCGAIPETLVESELFGYVKGAFTGADTDKPGHFELADGGTLFLDEIGNLSYPVQQKLLRAIQERKIQRVGSTGSLPVSVRIVAATNRPLEKDVKSGTFRGDLYFRLNEFALKMPSLKERVEDIPYLAKKFMDEAQIELDKHCSGFSREALLALGNYFWPGNVRELRNLIRQAVLLCEENAPVLKRHLKFSAQPPPPSPEAGAMSSVLPFEEGKSLKEIVNTHVDNMEKKIIGEALNEAEGNKSEAARKLKIDYKTLLRKIKKHQIASI